MFSHISECIRVKIVQYFMCSFFADQLDQSHPENVISDAFSDDAVFETLEFFTALVESTCNCILTLSYNILCNSLHVVFAVQLLNWWEVLPPTGLWSRRISLVYFQIRFYTVYPNMVLIFCLYYGIFAFIFAFSASTLLVGRQEEHPACKN